MKSGTYKVVITNTTESWYDTNGNQTYYKNSNGLEEWCEYDTNGKMIHCKDSNGLEAWYEYDSNGNQTYYKNSNGLEEWREYDSNGKMIHYKNSNGFERWYNTEGKKITKEEFDQIHSTCHGKVIEIEGKKYELKLL